MSGVVSGLTQGVASFTITLFIVKAVTWLFNSLPKSNLGVFYCLLQSR